MTDSSELLNIDKRRKALEEEAQAITDELTTSIDGKPPMGVSTPLIDEEGYPRGDIDVYRARHLRKRLNEIRFDHSSLMKNMEGQMVHTAEAAQNEQEMQARTKRKPKPKLDPISGKWVVRNWDGTVAGVENGHLRSFDKIGSDADAQMGTDAEKPLNLTNATTASSQPVEEDIPPFAKIENVLPGSPAQEAGLKMDDFIIKFGTIDYANHRHLRALGEIVSNAHLDGSGVTVLISRTTNGTERKMTLKLKPKTWSGNGLVGCVFSPML